MIAHATNAVAPVALADLRDRLRTLTFERDARRRQQRRAIEHAARIEGYLAISDAVGDALEKLSHELFARTMRVLQEHLTQALQEVLEQPLVLKARSEMSRGSTSITFHVERDGNEENIMKGQGGSVANVLSVGLRLFALTTLDPRLHRRFLVLDEQDCWLCPDLVPRLVRIVRDAGRALGFQVIMISHHGVGLFANYADKTYEFIPQPDGVAVREIHSSAPCADAP